MMNNDSRYVETQFDLREFSFRMFAQWKALLIAALVMMVIVTGLKYNKDLAGYNAAEEDQAEALTQAEIDARIAEIMDELGEDGDLVNLVLCQEEWLDQQYDYINNSLTMQMDPTNIRQVDFYYYVAGDNTESTKLYQFYNSYLMGDEFLDGLAKVIGLDDEVDIEQVKELVRVNLQSRLSLSSSSSSPSSYVLMDPTVMITVILPDGVEAGTVKDYVADAIKTYTAKITSVTPHELQLVSAEETSNFDQDLFNRKTNLVNNLNNYQNQLKTNTNAMSDAQTSAYNEIKALQVRAEENTEKANGTEGNESGIESVGGTGGLDVGSEKASDGEETETRTKPGISKKYALLGFVLGALIYMMAAVIIMIIRGRVNSPTEIEGYIGGRIVGAIYEHSDHHGVGKLLHSGSIERRIYKGSADITPQIDKTVSSVSAICSNKGVNDITIIDISSDDERNQRLLREVVDRLAERDEKIKAEVLHVEADIDENDLIKVKKAILFVTADQTGTGQLIELSGLCREFSIDCLGTIYHRVI